MVLGIQVYWGIFGSKLDALDFIMGDLELRFVVVL